MSRDWRVRVACDDGRWCVGGGLGEWFTPVALRAAVGLFVCVVCLCWCLDVQVRFVCYASSLWTSWRDCTDVTPEKNEATEKNLWRL